MGEPITDPLILQQIEQDQAKRAPKGPITDPIILDQIRKQQGGATGWETAYDVANQGARGVAKGFGDVARDAALLPLKTLGKMWGAPSEGVEAFEEFAKGETPLSHRPEAETTAGRYAGRVGEAIGATIPMSGGIWAQAARPAIPAITNPFMQFVRDRPLTALGIDLTSSTGGGLAGQTAEEAGAGPVGQGVASLAGGFAAPMGALGALKGYRGLQRVTDPAGDTGAISFGPKIRDLGAPNPEKVDERAIQIIADKAAEAGIKPEQLEQWLQTGARSRRFNEGSHAPDERVLADANEAFARLGASAVRQHGEAANVVRPFVTARQTGLMPEEGLHPGAGIATRNAMDKDAIDVGGQHFRERETLRRALRIEDQTHHKHGATAGQTDDMLIEAGRAAAQPLYDDLYKSAAMVNLRTKLQPIVDRLAKAAAEAPHTEAQHINRMLREFAPKGQAVANIERFDKAKQMADETLKKYFEHGEQKNAYLGRVMVQIKNEMVTAVDQAIEKAGLGKKYKEARDAFAGPAEARREIQLGRDLYSGKADVGAFHALPGRESQNRAKLGFFSAWEDEAANKLPHIDRSKMFSSPRQEKVLANIIERTETDKGKAARQVNKETGELERKEFADRPERFGSVMADEQAMIRTRDIVKGGSPTAERLADDAAFDTLHSLADVFKDPSATRVMKRSLQYALDKMFGMRAEVSAAVARKLFSADESVRAQVVAELKLRMGRSRFHRLAQIMAEQQRSLTGTTGGVASNLSPEQQ